MCEGGHPKTDDTSLQFTVFPMYNHANSALPDGHRQPQSFGLHKQLPSSTKYASSMRQNHFHSHIAGERHDNVVEGCSSYNRFICECSHFPEISWDGFYRSHSWLLKPLLSSFSSTLSTSMDNDGSEASSFYTSDIPQSNQKNNTRFYSQNIKSRSIPSETAKKANTIGTGSVYFVNQSKLISRYLLLLLLFAFIPISSKGEPVRVHIQAIIPSHFGWNTELTREFHNALVNFRRDQRNNRFRSLFNPDGDITFITNDTPREIMDIFCKGVLTKHSMAILNVNNPLGIRRRVASNEYILDLASFLGIPVISWDTQYSDTSQTKRTLQLAPTIEHQAMAMVSLLERYNWTDFTIITSQVAGDTQFVVAVNKLVEQSKVRALDARTGDRKTSLEILSTVHISKLSEAALKLGKLVGSDARVFLLHCSSFASYEIIETAVKLGLTGRDYVWILSRSSMPSGKHVPSNFPVGMLGISFQYDMEAMKRVVRTGVKIWLYSLLDMFSRPVEIVNRTLVPQFSCRSTVDPYWKDGNIIYRHMLSVNIRDEPNIEFTQNGTLEKTEINIVNLQWLDGQKNKTEWREVGKWTRHGLMMADITWPGESSVPPTGKPKRAFLRVATLNELPYVIYRQPREEGICEDNSLPCQVYLRDKNKDILNNATVLRCCAGLTMDLLRIFSTQLNFDFSLTEVQDGKWGGINKATKEWNGLVKVLLDNKADVVVTAMKINPERAEAVRFSVPYLETGIKIIVALRGGAISPTAFLQPYDYASWSLILIFSVHATGSSILIFEWLSPYGLNRGRTPMREHKFSLFRSFWLIWTMLFSTSVPTNSPKGIASRFLANIWALFALVFLASYTANLAAFMITKEEFYDLSGIQDYRLQNPYTMNPPFKYATIPNGSTEANIRSNHKDMFNYMKPYNQPDVDSGIEALKTGNIQAFIYDSSVLEYYASRDPQCRLVTVGNRYAMTGYGVGFQPDFQNPWIDKFNRVILKLQQTGELDRLQKFWLTGACKSTKESNLANRTLGILNFTSAFILLGAGVLLGLVILCLEHLYFIFWRKHLRELDKCGCCALVSLSVGKSLQTCDDRAIPAGILRARCKDPLCEAHIWKLKHQLDMALVRIDQLENKISYSVHETTNKTVLTHEETNNAIYHDKYIVALTSNETTHPKTTNVSNAKSYGNNYRNNEYLYDFTTQPNHESGEEYRLSKFPQNECLSCSRENQHLSDFQVLHGQSCYQDSNPLPSFSEQLPASSFLQPHRTSSFQNFEEVGLKSQFMDKTDTSFNDTCLVPSLPPPPLCESSSRGDSGNIHHRSAGVSDDRYMTDSCLSRESFTCHSNNDTMQEHGGVYSDSPAHKLRRTPSYTSAIGSSLNSDLTLDTNTCAATIRHYEGKQYCCVDNTNHLI